MKTEQTLTARNHPSGNSCLCEIYRLLRANHTVTFTGLLYPDGGGVLFVYQRMQERIFRVKSVRTVFYEEGIYKC